MVLDTLLSPHSRVFRLLLETGKVWTLIHSSYFVDIYFSVPPSSLPDPTEYYICSYVHRENICGDVKLTD